MNADGPKYRHLSIEWPADHNEGVVRSRVLLALESDGYREAAEEFVKLTSAVHEPADLYIEVARFVSITPEEPESGAELAPQLSALAEPLGSKKRWQYAVVNIGMFGTAIRMTETLGAAGAGGWELISVFDKSSNWIVGEKGFMLLKRPVPEGLSPDEWCLNIRN